MDPDYCNEAVARTVIYEIEMFRFLAGQLSELEAFSFIPGETTYRGTGGGDNDPAEWTKLESFLLHSRVLRGFFYGTRNPKNPKTSDDVVAGDFCPAWESLRPTEHSYLSANRERLHKALAHLTTSRVEFAKTEKRWEIKQIFEALSPCIELFLKEVRGKLHPWFEPWTTGSND